MTTQDELFAVGDKHGRTVYVPKVPVVHGSPTSEHAGTRIESSSATLRAMVLFWVSHSKDGSTREDIELGTGISGNTVRPRVAELIAMGMLRETDRVRATKSGRMAAVLEAV